MSKKMLIDATHPEETRVVVLDGSKIEDFDFESASKRQIAGNIYLAKVTRVEPSLQAAFVEYGGNRHGFLAFSEIHPDYYQIPKADRDALIAEEAEAARKRAEADAARDAERAERARRAEAAESERDEAETSGDDAPEGLEIIEPVDDADGPVAEALTGESAVGPDETQGEAVAQDDAPETAATPEAEASVGTAEADAEVEAEAPTDHAAADDAPTDDAPTDDAPTDDAPTDDAAADDGKKPDSIAEAAGTGDDETVEEDYPAAQRKPVEETAEGGAAIDAPAAADDAAQTQAEASGGDASVAEAPAAEGDAPAPVDAPREGEAQPAPATSDDDGAEAKGKADGDAVEGEAGSTEGGDGSENGDEDEDGRKRRRSRRGGRSRRSRKGRSRSDGEADGEGEAQQGDEAAASADGGSDAEGDAGGDADASDEAPTRSRGRGRGRGRDRDRGGRDQDARDAGDDVDAEGGDDMAEAISIRRIAQRRYKIQEVIKVRQILLVQVVKEERGNKGAALTTYLSLAGRYCVLMPNTARGGGISRKITSAADRKKLKEIANEFEVPQGMGLIVRTAGAKRTKSEIKRDYEYLLRAWAKIRDNTLKSAAPALIHEEGSLIKRVIRDMYSSDYDAIEVEGEQGWREARDYMSMLMPGHSRNVRLNQGDQPLFHKHGVEQELEQLFNPTVQLKSGGYIVIGVTEALVAIDINSGKSTKEGSIEDTALKTNLEASDEIARQLKLRDLAGLIVIDYIDMEEGRNNRAVEKRLKDRLKDDRARIQIGRISSFGLMEMSRQRLRPGMIEASTAACSHCHGTGVVRSDASLGLTILRRLTFEAARGRSPELVVKAPLGAASFLFNEKREHLAEIEAGSGVSIRVEADPGLTAPKFEIEKARVQTRTPATAAAVAAPAQDIEDAEEVSQAPAPAPAPARAPEARAEPAPEPARPAATQTEAKPSADEDDAEGEGGRRRRGRRGGRRRKKSDDAETVEAAPAAQEAETGDEAVAAPMAKPEEAEGAGAPAEIPAPRKTRRRRKKATSEDEGAEAAPAAAEVAETGAPEAAAAPESADAGSEVEADAAPAPETAERPEPDAPAEAHPEDAPVEASPEEAVEATAPAASEAEDAPEPEEAPAEAKPRRRGWWSR